MNEQQMNPQGQSQQKMEEMKQRAAEIQDKVMQGINKAMGSAAENLDEAANKLHGAAGFFREKSADTIKEDVSTLVKKHPTHTLIVAAVVGFVLGKILSR